jgi:hypothetical protein
MTYEPGRIDKGIPIPPDRVSGKAKKYPQLRVMEIGDSFFVPDKITNSMTNTLRCARPRKFRMRTRVEDGITGIRIWRIA